MRFRHYAMLSTMTGLALTAAPAMAADYGPAPPVYFEDQARSCFYLRGDVGGAFHTRPDAWRNVPPGVDPALPAGGVVEAVGEEVSSYGFFEAGVGCQLVDNMRFDITGGYRLKGSIDEEFDVVRSDWQAFTGFFNVYWDITNYGGFTPYLGGGVGVAHHRLTDVEVPGASSGSNTDFAWNVTAGLSYDVAPGLLVDLAYRFVDLGSAKSGGPLPFHVDDLQAHEVKLGMRYYLGSF